MNWQNTVESALLIVFVMVAFAGIAASCAIFWQIIRQGGWKLAEPAVIKSRWQMVRPWMLAGAVLGLLFSIAFVLLERDQPPLSPAPPDATTSPDAIKSRPRAGGQHTE
jgi:hypothetical protein